MTMTQATRSPDLHPEQHAAVVGILETFQGGDLAVLEGPAGTGKTFTVNGLRRETHRNVVMSAMTHAAAKQLDDGLTVHKALGFILKWVEGEPEQALVRVDKVHVSADDILVVDEASMLPSGMAKKIVARCREIGCKMLFVGDPYQLPPVKGKCPVFNQTKYPVFKLNTVHRQSEGNPILDLATRYRLYMDGDMRPENEPQWVESGNRKGEGIYLVDAEKFRDCQERYYDESVPDVITLTNTNDKSIAYNLRLRDYLMGDAAQVRIVPGEYVRLNDSAVVRARLIPNNTLTRATAVRTHVDKHGVPGLMVSTEFGDMFSPDNIKTAKALAARERKKASAMYKDPRVSRQEASRSWAMCMRLAESYIDLRHPYSSTVHKAQGSTYRTVFIDLENIRANPKISEKERMSMIYTALTRASTRVIVKL